MLDLVEVEAGHDLLGVAFPPVEEEGPVHAIDVIGEHPDDFATEQFHSKGIVVGRRLFHSPLVAPGGGARNPAR